MNGVPAGLQVYPSKDQFIVLRANGFIHLSTNYDPTTAPEFVADAFYPYLAPSDYFAQDVRAINERNKSRFPQRTTIDNMAIIPYHLRYDHLVTMPAMPYVGQYGHHSTQQPPQQLRQQTTPSARYEQQRDNKSKAHVPVYNSPPSRTLAATPSQAAPVAPFSTANTVQVPVGLRSDIGKESDHNDAITTLAYSLNTQHPQHSGSNRVIAHPSEKRKSRAIPMEAVSTPEEFIAKWMTGSASEDSPGPSDKPSSNKKRQRDGHAHANATKRPRGVQSMASTDTRSRRPQQAQFTSNTGSQDATQADERPAQTQAGYHGPDR
ncbi:hypothetical protein N0V95_007580 [Ascochyta clinopodiicola]|nr:hypothetical protein N0V95_007580 [Ascochyta clinopodiicola]